MLTMHVYKNSIKAISKGQWPLTVGVLLWFFKERGRGKQPHDAKVEWSCPLATHAKKLVCV